MPSNYQAALDALNREGQAVVTLEKTSDLDSLDPQINYNTARALVQKGVARFEVGPTAWAQEGLWLMAHQSTNSRVEGHAQ